MDGDIRVTFETEQKYELQHGSDYVVTVARRSGLRNRAVSPGAPPLDRAAAASGAPGRVPGLHRYRRTIAARRPLLVSPVLRPAIGCGGFEECWTGRAGAWAVLSDDAGRHMVRITRAVKRGLELHSAERIETTVQAGFEAGMRWAKALGFEEEGLRRRYHDGHDHVAFVLLKTSQ
jgi:hypothetical protein